MPGYRPPSTEPRGKWAKRIHEKRRAEGISQTGAFELLGARLGFGPKSRYSYVALDMGTREPTEAEAAVLAEWLGGYPEDPPEPLGSPQATDQVVAAIDRQTAMLERVLNAILTRLPPSEDPETLAVLAKVAEAERELLAERRGSGSPLRAPRPAGPGEEQRSTRRSGEKAG